MKMMLNKILLRFLLPIALLGAFSFPISAYAYTDAETEDAEITESAVPSDDDTADEDTANPLTPDGQASVTDVATDADGKEFYTFTTPAGNVFYLIIDHEKESDNVYFLNAITEYDLMLIAEASDDVTIPTTTGSESAIPDDTAANTAGTGNNNDADTDADTDTEQTDIDTADSGGSKSYIFIIFAVAVFGVAAYYFKVLLPKKKAAAETEFDDDDYAENDVDDEYNAIEPDDDDEEYGEIDDSDYAPYEDDELDE